MALSRDPDHAWLQAMPYAAVRYTLKYLADAYSRSFTITEAGLDRQQCALHMQRTVGRHIRGLGEDDLTHLDRVLLPILRRLARERPPEAGPVLLTLWEAVMQGRVRLYPKVPASTYRLEGWFGRFQPRGRLTRGLKTEAGALNFVCLTARGMA